MFTLPNEFSTLISVFSSTFSTKVFERTGQLLLGCILTQGKRTICSILRSLGLSKEKNWSKYHQVLYRANWDALFCARQLLKLLTHHFVGDKESLVFVIDETIERRWGQKIKPRGIYRDAVRSSKSHFVKCSGLRWICLMLLVPIKWAGRTWALPFLTVLAPSERYHTERGKVHKKLTDWARQMALQIGRWLPDNQLVIVADNSYSVIELLAAKPENVNWITPLRIDAALYKPAPLPNGKVGRNRKKGVRLPTLEQVLNCPKTQWQSVTFSEWYGEKDKPMEITTGTAVWYHSGKPVVPLRWVLIRDPEGKLEPRAILCTDPDLEATEIVQHFVYRWQVEVTFEEVRAHLGVETQRQWSDLSIARTTPVLMALFSLITLWANWLFEMKKLTVFSTSWYRKSHPTFSDAIASVRYRIWDFQHFYMSEKNTDIHKLNHDFFKHLWFMAARAA